MIQRNSLKNFTQFRRGARTTRKPVCHSSLRHSKQHGFEKVTQNSYIIAQVELEQQSHLFVMQAFDLQNNKLTIKIRKITPICLVRVTKKAQILVMQTLDFQNRKDSTKIAQKFNRVSQESQNNTLTCLPYKHTTLNRKY